MALERIHPQVVVTEWSPNCYHGRGVPIQLIVIHDTESHPNPVGNMDLRAIGNLFADWRTTASAHVCTNTEGRSGRYVHDEDAAWECVAYNRMAIGIEQIGFASQTEWPDEQVKETARWVARWHHIHGVPIRKGRTLNGHVMRSGVVTHKSLGSIGGGHSDPGDHYPMKRLLALAQHYARELAK